MCENRNLGCYGWQIKFAEKLTEKNLRTSETSVILYLQDIEAKVYQDLYIRPDTKYKMKCMIKR